MTEYIKREDAINLFLPVDPENDGSDGCTVVLKCGHYNSNEIEAMLSDLPAAEVAEVRHGRWKNGICTDCGFDIRCLTDGENDLEEWVWEGLDYCPNCGCRMDKEAEHEAD